MAVIGLLLGHLPQARATRQLVSLLHDAAPRGTRLVELTYGDLPHHAPYTDAPMPAAGIAWKRQFDQVDGVLVVTPTHERSLPGALKNAIDWAVASPNALAGRPVAIAGAAAPRRSYFAALTHLRTVLNDAGAEVMGQPERTLSVESSSFGPAGNCVSIELEAQALDVLSAAAGYVTHVVRSQGREPRKVGPQAPGGSGATPTLDPGVPADPPAGASSLEPEPGAAPTIPTRVSTMPTDPVAAVRAAEARSPGPASPDVGTPQAPDGVVGAAASPRQVFVDSVSTADPLVDTADPIIAALRTDSTTGTPDS